MDTKLIGTWLAELMMSHFTNPLDSPYEWVEDDVDHEIVSKQFQSKPNKEQLLEIKKQVLISLSEMIDEDIERRLQ